jgi:hypothetical protein
MSFHIYEDMKTIPLFDEDLEIETGGGPESVRRQVETSGPECLRDEAEICSHSCQILDSVNVVGVAAET